MKWIRLITAICVCLISVTLWWVNFSRSPLMDHDINMQRQYLNAMHDELAPDLQNERLLAIDYWLRYPDVRKNDFWGEKSRLGIKGPADHYRHHGRREGRIYAKVIKPDDMALERKLAEAYWNRYQDIARSPIWGRDGSLGVLGPRDHYRFYGQGEGRVWDAK